MTAPGWKRILIHHSAGHDRPGLDLPSIRAQHRAQGWRDVGYHFVVEEVDGATVALMGRPLSWEGSHCPGQNKIAVGVCLVGDFTKAPPSPALLGEAARLVSGLCAALRIPVSEIHPHREFKATACPGDSFPFEQFRGLVLAELEAAGG